MPMTVAQICRYPVKGLSPDPLTGVVVTPDARLPYDRRFAIAHGTTRFDGPPRWLPRSNFLVLARNARLAALDTAFDADNGVLSVSRKGRVVSRGKIVEPTGRAVLEEFFAAYLGPEVRGRPRIVELADDAFTDVPDAWLSLINLASIRDLERVVRQPIDPRRFRGNLYLEGLEPWQEFTWAGREVEVGAARLAVTEPITRCAATNANPDTGEQDLNLPLALQNGFSHVDMGVYARVVAGGTLSKGDTVQPPDEHRPA